MPKENEIVIPPIVIRPRDLPEADREFGITGEDRDLTEAKVLIEGIPVVPLEQDEDSVTVKAPTDVDHDEPLQIVVTTNSDKVVGVLNYRWNKGRKEWELRPDPDDDETEVGLSPIVKAIGDAAKEIVHAIEELKGGSTKPAGGRARSRQE